MIPVGSSDDVHDAAVVGSGPNGLAAAIVLSEADLRVVVLEGEDAIGGAARTEPLTRAGFLHDVCSAVHPLAVASPLFRRLPLARLGLEWVQPEVPLAHPLDGGRAVLLERSPVATAQALGRDGPAYLALVEPLVERWSELLPELLAPPLHVPRRPLLLARFATRALRSARGLAARFRDTPARALFAGMAAHAALPLDRTASSATGLVLALAGHAVGWPFPRGGAGRISDTLAAHLRVLGGELRTGHPVRTLDDLPSARAALFAVGPPALARIAATELPARYLRRLRTYRYGPGVFKIDWALDGPIPWSAAECARAGTVHLGGSLEEIATAEQATWRGEPAPRPFVLLSQPSGFDPTRAPAGGEAVWAYCHVPSGSRVDMTERIETQVERFAPGFRKRVVARATRSAAALAAQNPNCVGGDVTGGVTDLRQLFVRPTLSFTPYATPDPRLWICSASTPPGGGVHGMCGHHAARALLSRGLV